MKTNGSNKPANNRPQRTNKPPAKDRQVQNKPQFKGKQSREKAEVKPVHFVVNPRLLQHQLQEAEKVQHREAFQQQKEAKNKKFADFQKRKFERNKILGQKTKRGQPVMKGRMEMLLNKIQYQISKE